MSALEFEPGGCRFVKGVFKYSAGVAAMPKSARAVSPASRARRRISAGRTDYRCGRTAADSVLCLRASSSHPFREGGFTSFNKIYIGTLERWKIFDGTTNPVARSNVCPAIDPPAEPCFYAFTYKERAPAEPLFIVADSGEAPEGRGDHVFRLGDLTPAGLRETARFVLGEMERRMAALSFRWQDTTATQVSTIHDIHAFLAERPTGRGARRADVALQSPAPSRSRI
jgi:hypothetical protein